jgi:hypothetical protein
MDFNLLNGLFVDDIAVEEQNAAVEMALAHVNQLRETLLSPGWKKLEAAIKSDLEIAKRGLLSTKTFEDTLRLQEYVKAREEFLSFISTQLEHGENLLKEEKEYQEALTLSGQARRSA